MELRRLKLQQRLTLLSLLLCVFIMQRKDMIFNASGSVQFRAIAFAMTSITTNILPVIKKRTISRNSRWLSTTASPDVGESNMKNVVVIQSETKPLTSALRGGSTEDAVSSSTNDDSSNIDDEVPNNTSTSLPLTVPALPTVRQYMQFALPCLALWIAGPLLSLVDTSFIGLSSQGGNSARQLAALGPATTL